MPRTLELRLGRNCSLIVDGTLLQSVTDALLRVRTTTQEATGGGSTASAEIVVRRDLSIDFTLLDWAEAQFMDSKVAASPGADPIVEVHVANGHLSRVFLAKVHDVDEGQGVGEVVSSRWELRQWGQRVTA